VFVRGDAGLDPESGGTLTTDGWRIAFDRFLGSLGDVSLEGNDCITYNESDYLRVFELRGAEPQHVSVAYALGVCNFEFGVANPDERSPLGRGVSETDRRLLGTPGSDAFATNAASSWYVAGRASRAGATKRFAWTFRTELDYDECATADQSGFELGENATLRAEIVIESVRLWADAASAELRFDPFARADDAANADGEISLTELEVVPGNTPGDPERTLAHELYLDRVPEMPRFQGTGSCQVGPPQDSD
jgi:hypothetical protein